MPLLRLSALNMPQELSNLMEKIRLSKLMSQQGLCSRREADNYIELGWVFVDGERYY